ncbi:MAG TPA: GvpL/GvpF family gas vesicle protein [Terriglobales bacterium]|nr:GvpL/GvpF family gas vesicle protein [Terriglobales bacterium]
MNRQKTGSVRTAPKPRKAEKVTTEDVHVKISEMPLPRMVERGGPEVAAAAPAPGLGGRYVYGIIEARDAVNFGKMGIGGTGEMVYTIHYNDIAAVVSKTDVYIFDPTRENALAHEHVIETVMKAFTIIPMSFGTVFRTDDDIREVLRSIYVSLKDVLKQMAGKVEFGLKVNWDRDQVIEELKREDEEIHRFNHEITRKHLQSTYLARMQLGRMIDKAMVERSAQYVREIYDTLRSVCVASRDNKPIGDKMIMNAAFLIDREKETDFDEAVNKIARKFGDRLNFKYTGPWPPYNFVNIRLKLERGTGS